MGGSNDTNADVTVAIAMSFTVQAKEFSSRVKCQVSGNRLECYWKRDLSIACFGFMFEACAGN